MDLRRITYSYHLKEQDDRRFFPDAWRAHSLLEVGCGTGAVARFFPQYLGLDLFFMEGVRTDFPRIRGRAEMLPLRAESVDYVLCNSLLEHLRDPQPALNEMYRVCRMGGMVGVPVLDDFPFIYDPINWVRKKMGKPPVNFGIGGFGHVTVSFSSTWEERFRKAGFTVESVTPEGSLDLFATLEFLFFSIFFSSMEYVQLVSRVNRGPGRLVMVLGKLLFPLYRFLHFLNLRLNGSITYYYLLKK